MLTDILTVAWKEWRELLFTRNSGKRGVVGTLVLPVLLAGVLMPWNMGTLWVSPIMLLTWVFMPAFVVMAVIADSFAGERERHTLETLLASRLPDRAILFGKFGALVAYGWGLNMVILPLSLLTLNLTRRGGDWVLYSRAIGCGAVVLSLLAACAISGAGILVSLRAATVRQAAQTLSLSVFIVFFGLIFGFGRLPESFKKTIKDWLISLGEWNVVFAIATLLLAANAVLIPAAMARFRRARLVFN